MEAMTNMNANGCGEEDLNTRLPARSARNAPSGYELLLAQGLRSARGLDSLRPDPATDGLDSTATDPCTLADQALDKAQAFCETGAYHFLREGECAEEVSGARGIFNTLKQNCEKEAEKLTALERARQRERDAERVVEQNRHRQSRTEVAANPALIQPDSFDATIEADDENADEEEDYALLTPPYRTLART
jgi:hypothetical protein